MAWRQAYQQQQQRASLSYLVVVLFAWNCCSSAGAGGRTAQHSTRDISKRAGTYLFALLALPKSRYKLISLFFLVLLVAVPVVGAVQFSPFLVSLICCCASCVCCPSGSVCSPKGKNKTKENKNAPGKKKKKRNREQKKQRRPVLLIPSEPPRPGPCHHVTLAPFFYLFSNGTCLAIHRRLVVIFFSFYLSTLASFLVSWPLAGSGPVRWTVYLPGLLWRWWGANLDDPASLAVASGKADEDRRR